MRGLRKGLSMKASLFVTTLLVSALCFSNNSARVGTKVPVLNGQAKDSWRAATYRGLTVGKSTLTMAKRIFGKPKWIVPEADRVELDPDPSLHYGYDKGGVFPGKLVIIVGERSKRVQAISNQPEKLSKEEAIRHFGNDYVIGRYSFCPDFDNEPSEPIYEDPSGTITQIEYRNRGIVLYTDAEGEVSEILYVAGQNALKSEKECEENRLRKARSRR